MQNAGQILKWPLIIAAAVVVLKVYIPNSSLRARSSVLCQSLAPLRRREWRQARELAKQDVLNTFQRLISGGWIGRVQYTNPFFRSVDRQEFAFAGFELFDNRTVGIE